MGAGLCGVVMKQSLRAAALMLAFVLPAGLTAESGVDELIRMEQSSLDGMPSRYLRQLLSATSNRSQQSSVDEKIFNRAWVDAQPVAKGDAEWSCLTEALYFEARGETVKGQFAVAEVIQNRVKSARFPDTFCGVINQGTGRKYQCQFTYTCDGLAETIREPRAYDRVAKVARAVMDGKAGDLTGGATFYHTIAVKPSWSKKFTRTARIGVHIFYRRDRLTASN